MTGVLAVKIVQVEHKKEYVPQVTEDVVVYPLLNNVTPISVVSEIALCRTLNSFFDAKTVVKCVFQLIS